MRAAAIGIGSNSLRLLVADVANGKLTEVLRGREGLRVFASLNEHLEISPDMIKSACGSINRMKRKAELFGAQSIRLFATSAVRDAINKQEFSAALLRNTGLHLDILSGETEAKLSFIGAENGVRCGMIDIGGGSTEVVIGEREVIDYAVSLQAGAVRLFREMPIHSVSDARQVTDAVKGLLTPYLAQIFQQKTPAEWVGVGGTMTAAATCLQGIDWDASEGVHGFIAKRTDLRNALFSLAGMSPVQRRCMRSIPPDRADIIAHGFAILLGCMETLDIQTITISERTNLDGYLKLFTKDE